MKVRRRDADKVVETYALLDSGSDISLCDKTLATDKVEVKRLWTVDRLNASRRKIPSDSGLTLKTKLPSISEKEVRLIVGTNAPEAFWVLEERRGNRGEPYAIRTPLGWTLMGPVGGIDCRERHLNVNFVRLV